MFRKNKRNSNIKKQTDSYEIITTKKKKENFSLLKKLKYKFSNA